MFGIGFSTRDDFHEIPGKKNICLFGYNFSSSSRNKVNTSQRRTLYTTFYDGRQWRKLEESVLPEVGDEWAPSDDPNKVYSANSIPPSVVEKAKESDAWLPVRDPNSGGVYWWHPRSNATTPIGSGKPETLMRALGNSAMFGAGAAMFFALLYRVFGICAPIIESPVTLRALANG
ncbi:hypothetical protein Pmar_PMAR015945 [Perkinsus marinus ATCC 50983]|uniref:Uncharacterized protein n=1 Tax=Perkinsus marinus (strain ATCC 50983 / TXsc) TaxID=423536 RepID=C5LAQ5_PERM5|nr:hypothetical protein Pmar_PMAR015945 [Perkinsus marinus ATCC 50983]EER06183.1 hypothetical protein Pmar_PMAR015945 [Perkinsus marinus ATCC 50983]|eukprot:XP_002774367.1 hypothetical protein Pmar_PMAR015945 [Perkinsus marinus ATCC 50983]